MLMVSGEKDNIAPRAISQAAYKKQLKNPGITEFVEVPAGATPSRSTAAGAKWRTSRWLSSSASCKKRSVFVRAWRDDHGDLGPVGRPTFLDLHLKP